MHSLKEAKEVKYCELDISLYSGVTHIQLNSRIWISNIIFSLDPTQLTCAEYTIYSLVVFWECVYVREYLITCGIEYSIE